MQEALLMSYLLPDEKPYVVLKSMKEEFIFTDTGTFHVVRTHT